MNKNKYYIFTILILTILSYNSFSQIWPKFYSHSGIYDFSDDFIISYDSGYILCGNFYNASSSTQSSWIIKTDVNGIVLWDKIIQGGDELMRTHAIDMTEDGNIVICGSIWTDSGGLDPFAMKLNSCGEKEWCTIFASSPNTNPWAEDIKIDSNGDIILLVNQYGEYNLEDLHLFKLNQEGESLWKKSYCSPSIYSNAALPFGRKLIITHLNDYMIAGEVYWSDPWNPGGPKPLRSLFVMVDSKGNEKWVLPFGLQDSIHGQGTNILEINSNRYIGLANKWPTETMQTVFIEFDSLGNNSKYVILENQQIGPEISKGVPINLQPIDTLYILGGIYGNPNAGFSSEILLDTNIFSDPTIYNFFQHAEEEEPYSMAITLQKKILSSSTYKETGNWNIALSKLDLNLEYDTLNSGTYTYDSLCTTPGLPQSGFILLDDCDIFTRVDIPSPEEHYSSVQVIHVTVFPNPAKDKITFGLENTDHHKNINLKCFNLLGRRVFETTVITGQKEAAIDVSRWPQGMYVAVVYSEGIPAGKCKFVVQ